MDTPEDFATGFQKGDNCDFLLAWWLNQMRVRLVIGRSQIQSPSGPAAVFCGD